MAKNCSKILRDLELQYNLTHDHLTLGQNFAKLLKRLEQGNCDRYLGGKVKRLRQGWYDCLVIAETDHFNGTKPDPVGIDENLAECKDLSNCSLDVHQIGNGAAKRMTKKVEDVCKDRNKLEIHAWREWFMRFW